MGILEKAQEMLEKYPLCNHCLGRQFALLGYGLDDEKRGESIKTLLTMKANELALRGIQKVETRQSQHQEHDNHGSHEQRQQSLPALEIHKAA